MSLSPNDERQAELVGLMVCARAALGAIRRACRLSDGVEDYAALERLRRAIQHNIDGDIRRGTSALPDN